MAIDTSEAQPEEWYIRLRWVTLNYAGSLERLGENEAAVDVCDDLLKKLRVAHEKGKMSASEEWDYIWLTMRLAYWTLQMANRDFEEGQEYARRATQLMRKRVLEPPKDVASLVLADEASEIFSDYARLADIYGHLDIVMPDCREIASIISSRDFGGSDGFESPCYGALLLYQLGVTTYNHQGADAAAPITQEAYQIINSVRRQMQQGRAFVPCERAWARVKLLHAYIHERKGALGKARECREEARTVARTVGDQDITDTAVRDLIRQTWLEDTVE